MSYVMAVVSFLQSNPLALVGLALVCFVLGLTASKAAKSKSVAKAEASAKSLAAHVKAAVERHPDPVVDPDVAKAIADAPVNVVGVINSEPTTVTVSAVSNVTAAPVTKAAQKREQIEAEIAQHNGAVAELLAKREAILKAEAAAAEAQANLDKLTEAA